MTDRKLVSVIVPMYNEVENVKPLIDRLGPVADGLANLYDFEFLFVDDGSSDGTFELLEGLAPKDDRIRILRLSRNFGFQRAIITGLLKGRGAAAIQIDADLQDPPSCSPSSSSCGKPETTWSTGFAGDARRGSWRISPARRSTG